MAKMKLLFFAPIIASFVFALAFVLLPVTKQTAAFILALGILSVVLWCVNMSSFIGGILAGLFMDLVCLSIVYLVTSAINPALLTY